MAVVYKLHRKGTVFSVELVEIHFVVGAANCNQGVVLGYFDNAGFDLGFNDI